MATEDKTAKDENQRYFESYNNPHVHSVMLNDGRRVESYRYAIFQNKEYIRGKFVLDVGAGTGIMSVFFAQAGAAKVFAVEASEIASVLKDVVAENDFSHIIEVIKGDVETIQLPCKVDIIVSEWMGHYLLHEAMLHSVLIARDKFLKEDGIMFPEYCALYAAPCVLYRFYDRWKDVNGVQMTSFAKVLLKYRSNEPKIMNISSSDLISDGYKLFDFQMKELQLKDADAFSGKMLCTSVKVGRCHGICLWFTVEFPVTNDTDHGVFLSTGPDFDLTHWEQSVIVLPEEIEYEKGDPIFADFLFERDGSSRKYNVTFTQLNPEEELHPTPCDCRYDRCKIIKAFIEQQTMEEENAEDEHAECFEEGSVEDENENEGSCEEGSADEKNEESCGEESVEDENEKNSGEGSAEDESQEINTEEMAEDKTKESSEEEL